MLRIVSFEEIQMLINEISGLVDLYENKDPDFSVKVKMWLKRMEKTLENNRLPLSGKIGALRSMIIAAEQGIIPESVQFSGQPTRKKIKNATAIKVLQNAGDTVSNIIIKDYERFNEAEKQIRQILSVIKVKGLLNEFSEQKNFDTQTLKNIWQIIRSDNDLIQGAVNVESLVGLYDALIILNRQLVNTN